MAASADIDRRGHPGAQRLAAAHSFEDTKPRRGRALAARKGNTMAGRGHGENLGGPVPDEEDMLGLARLSLREAGRAGEAASRLAHSPHPRDYRHGYGEARAREVRETTLGILQAQIATAEMLQRLVGRPGEVPAISTTPRISRTRGLSPTNVGTEGFRGREQALQRIEQLCTAAEEAGEHIVVSIDYPDRAAAGERPPRTTVSVPGQPRFGDTRLEKEEHPTTSRSRRVGA